MFIYFVGINTLQSVLSQVSLSLVLLMVALELVGFVFYANAWYVLIRATGHKIAYLTCQGITFASIFAGMVMPSGIFLEATRCILGSKESGMNLGESTSTVVLHRILYIIGFLGATALAMTMLILGDSIGVSIATELAVIPLISVMGLVVLLAMSLNARRLEPFLDRFLRLMEPLFKLVQSERRMAGKANQFLTEYHEGFREMIKAKLHLLASFAASLGDWSCSVMVLWIIILSLGVNISIWAVIVTMSIGKMIQMTPIAVPGMLGIFETAVTVTLSFFAVPVAVAASAALLLRIVTTWLDLPITGIAAYHYGFKLLGR